MTAALHCNEASVLSGVRVGISCMLRPSFLLLSSSCLRGWCRPFRQHFVFVSFRVSYRWAHYFRCPAGTRGSMGNCLVVKMAAVAALASHKRMGVLSDLLSSLLPRLIAHYSRWHLRTMYDEALQRAGGLEADMLRKDPDKVLHNPSANGETGVPAGIWRTACHTGLADSLTKKSRGWLYRGITSYILSAERAFGHNIHHTHCQISLLARSIPGMMDRPRLRPMNYAVELPLLASVAAECNQADQTI